MTNKRNWVGILALVLVFGMTVVGCDPEPTDDTLAIPMGLSATALSSSSVQVQWSSVSGAAQYWLERKEGESGSFGFRQETSSTSYTYTELKANTTYYFRVAAWNSDVGLGDYSSPVSVTTSGFAKPPMPSISAATAVNGSSSSVKITWTAVTVTESYTPNYRVYYKKGNLADTPTDLTEATSSYPISGTEYTVTGLDALTDYVFFIKATSSSITNSSGVDSDFSLPKTAKTNVAKPANVNNSVVNTTTIKVTWDSVPSATSYKVYYKKITDLFAIDNTDITGTTLFQTVTAPATTIDVTGLTYGDAYYFFVVAVGTTGDGSFTYTSRLTWF
jgi:fibronectin type 3 domain-containing protein